MDKSRILRLKRLASSLSKIEKRNFQILNGCEPNSGRASLKTIEVWNMLQSTSGSLFELSRTENGRKMIENLEQKVLDHLLMDNIIHKNAKDSPQLQLLKQAKYLLKAKLLYERGYYRKALSIATNIQKGASQLECFDLKLQAIHLKISIAVIINEYDLYSTILKEKQDCINIYNRLYNLTCIYYDLKIQYKNNALNKNSFNTIKRFIKDSIKDDDVYSCKVAQFIIEYFKLIMAKHGDEYNFKACLQNLYGLADQAILHNLISSLGEIQLEEANYFIRNRNDIKAQNLLHKCPQFRKSTEIV